MPGYPGQETVHASCVAMDGQAVLIFGASGAGKSDLTLRLLDRGAALVSDDYTLLQRMDEQLTARAPPNIAGKIEVRGVGIVDWPYIAEAPVALGLTLESCPERMPPEILPNRSILGIDVPFLALDGLHASAPIKVELAVRGIVDALQKRKRAAD